ncbi:MAG: DUF3800 domain-containing protein [Deltaproteobacteria bacterium]|nr:DUF3800 domain-containing protein [Deltaproteobacteria bacterium]
MWFFVDESWSADTCIPKFGVLLGVLVKDEELLKLDKFLFSVRRKYYGSTNAKNRNLELKGKDLLNKYILKQCIPGKSTPKNLCIVKEMLSYPPSEIYLKIFASTVFSATNRHPPLLSPNPKLLSEPFKHLIENVSEAASKDAAGRKVTLVFDQRIGPQTEIAIAINNYVAGMKLPNIEIFPYFAVSQVSPGVQFADVMAYLLAKRTENDRLYKPIIMELYNFMKELCWESQDGKRFGLCKFNEKIIEGVPRYTRRK